MAAFSNQQQHHPFLLDSVFLPNNSGMVMEEGNFMNNNFFSTEFPLPQEINDNNINSLEYCRVFESNCVDHRSVKITVTDNEISSLTKKQTTVSSTMVDNNKLAECSEQVAHSTVTRMDRKRKKKNIDNCSSSNSTQSKDPREVKNKKQRKCNDAEKAEEEKNPKAEKQNQKKVPEEPPKDYIHVRARRGQATDSHSLAERVRREKISVRMKTLQQLVPGCDKVIGKALMLDEIINYVQSLQNQVEFLSMKLASVNPMFYEFGMEQDAFVVRPDDQRLNAVSVPLLQSVRHCSPTQLTAFADKTTTAATSTAGFGLADHNCYPILDSTTASLLIQQGQRPNDFAQDNGSLLCDVEEQKHKFLNPFGFTNDLCPLH